MKLLLTLCLLVVACHAANAGCGAKLVSYHNCIQGQINRLRARTGCQSGTTGTKVHWTKKRPNDGETITVRFPRRMRCRYALTVALTGSDTYRNKNTRLQTNVIKKYSSGFKLRVKTWAGSIVYGAWYSYMACCK